jgi:LmbE family N-acetylglucosaminyl deacetylase
MRPLPRRLRSYLDRAAQGGPRERGDLGGRRLGRGDGGEQPLHGFRAGRSQECLRTLDAHGIRHCGAGDCPRSARCPAVLEAKGIRIGMLGYADDYRPALPLDSAAGPAPVRDEEILQDLRAIRPTVDILVLQLHIMPTCRWVSRSGTAA